MAPGSLSSAICDGAMQRNHQQSLLRGISEESGQSGFPGFPAGLEMK